MVIARKHLFIIKKSRPADIGSLKRTLLMDYKNLALP